MPWVRFTSDFDFDPRHGVTIAYKAGMVLNVTRRCAERAIEIKRAVRMRKISRHVEPVEARDGQS